jgi:serpin B
MDTMATARNTFATRLYDKLASAQAGKNLFLSPFSIEVALAMTAVGARGPTRLVMADLIGAPESIEEQNHQYARLLESIYGEGKRPLKPVAKKGSDPLRQGVRPLFCNGPFELVTANALWGQKGYPFQPAFQEAIADFYDGAMHVVDFRGQPDEAVKTINAWVSDKTRAKIQELIQRNLIDNDTCLILTNAIYFKGQWEQPFKAADTKNEDWYGSEIRKVPMMHQRGGYLYYEGKGFQALDIPYQGEQLSMLIVLPRKKDGLAAVERQWVNGDTYRQVAQGLDHEENVLLSLPRFKMETVFMLKPVLCALHAELAFSDEADFSGIGDKPLKISEVVHKAFVEVNEEGTEAAAATAVLMIRCAGLSRPAPQPIVFKADHPFLLFIRDRRTNAVLFSGRVLDPS